MWDVLRELKKVAWSGLMDRMYNTRQGNASGGMNGVGKDIDAGSTSLRTSSPLFLPDVYGIPSLRFRKAVSSLKEHWLKGRELGSY